MRSSSTRSRVISAVIGYALLAACAPDAASTPGATPSPTLSVPAAYPSIQPGTTARWIPDVVARIPHDAAAWTQGLEVHDGVIYESTGLYGESTVRALDRRSGEVLQRVALESNHYGEGLTIVDGRLLQLTWQEKTLLVRDIGTLAEVDRIGYEGEGWGLCLDGNRLIMSDGSSTLISRDPETFRALGSIEVRRDGSPLNWLNELECIGGLVFANILAETDIAVVDVGTGALVAIIDASSLAAEVADAPDGSVLNGIAYDASSGTFLMTGKLWPVIFEVTLREAP